MGNHTETYKRMADVHDACCRAADELIFALEGCDKRPELQAQLRNTIATVEAIRDRASEAREVALRNEPPEPPVQHLRLGKDRHGPRWFLVASETAMLDALAGKRDAMDPVHQGQGLVVWRDGRPVTVRFSGANDGTAYVYDLMGSQWPVQDGERARRLRGGA